MRRRTSASLMMSAAPLGLTGQDVADLMAFLRGTCSDSEDRGAVGISRSVGVGAGPPCFPRTLSVRRMAFSAGARFGSDEIRSTLGADGRFLVIEPAALPASALLVLAGSWRGQLEALTRRQACEKTWQFRGVSSCATYP